MERRIIDNGTSQPDMELKINFFDSIKEVERKVREKFGKDCVITGINPKKKEITIKRRK